MNNTTGNTPNPEWDICRGCGAHYWGHHVCYAGVTSPPPVTYSAGELVIINKLDEIIALLKSRV